MPVNTCHPEHTSVLGEWCVMRDVVKGQKQIQYRGEKYLSKLSDQTPEEYAAYKKRATFFNATGRVVDTMVGAVFRKDPVIKTPAKMEDILEDMTLSGVPFIAFAQDVVKECIEVNRAGVLVDYPTTPVMEGDAPLTVALAEKMSLRVYATKYTAEQIVNWRTVQVGGKTVLSLVVLCEHVHEVSESDVFCLNIIEQYRVLKLENGVYIQEIHRPNRAAKATGGFQLYATYIPKMNGNSMDFIPFVFFSSKGNEPCIVDPLLYDLAVVNLAHYRNDADLEHGLHFTGLPTAVITGVTDTDATYSIGSGVAWTFSNKDAKATYLEFKGEGLKQLSDAKKDKEEQMAALGARMLSPDKNAVEAADTIAQKRQGENSSLGALANSVGRGLSLVLTFMAQWSAATGEVSVKLNTDYSPVGMSPQTITALLQAVMTSNLSSQSFYEALVKGEVVAGTRDFDQEQALIEEDMASRPPANDNTKPPAGRAAA